MFEEMVSLANTLAQKLHISDDERLLYRNLLSFISLQTRMLQLAAEREAREMGCDEEIISGYPKIDD